MGFKMKGTSMHSGTSAHESALKIKSVEARKQEVAATGQASAAPVKQKLAYGGTKTWGQGQKDSGNTLNAITIQQRAYEKEMKAKDPKWNKREDNTWKTTQNKINRHLGSKVVYDTIPDKKTVVQTDSRGTNEVIKGLQRKGEKTLTETEKQAEKIDRGIIKDKIDVAKGNEDRDTRDELQHDLASSKSGDKDKYTGTVVSRTVGKINKAINKKQLAIRDNRRKNLEKKIEKRKGKGKDTEKLEKRLAKKTSPAKHTGSASHPTEAIVAHEGHMMKKTGRRLKPKKKSPTKHLGNASHPTEAIAAHKGHMSKKMTKKTGWEGIKRDIVPK